MRQYPGIQVTTNVYEPQHEIFTLMNYFHVQTSSFVTGPDAGIETQVTTVKYYIETVTPLIAKLE
jgi:hypothetical protein